MIQLVVREAKEKMNLRFASSFTFILLLITKIALLGLAANVPTAQPGCKDSCGNVSVPYPFGIGPNCFMHPWFEVSCNETSSTPPRPLLKSINNMEVLNFSHVPQDVSSYSTGYVRVKSPVISRNCSSREREASNQTQKVDLTDTPFFYSDRINKFIAAGCNNRAFMSGIEPTIVGCESSCINNGTADTQLLFSRTPNSNKTCNNATCCETVIPSVLKTFGATFESESQGCKLAFVADQEWLDYNITNPSDLQSMNFVPALLDWSLPIELLPASRREFFCSVYSSEIEESYPNNSVSGRCHCQYGYQGNPYLSNGCQDIDECLDERNKRSCGEATCVNKQGYFSCEGSKTWIIALGIGLGFGVLCLVIGGWLLYKFIKKKRKQKLKQKFFKRNGGLLLQQQMYSHEGNLETSKIFTSKELDKATDSFNNNRVIGQGGQGTVYKGMLVDGRIVAVKKSKATVVENVQDFINEVVVLSRINHRNVVKLLGCCLETEVPLLVYEFISNGTLFHYLHDQGEEFELSWETRLRIAKESAEALSYLHYSASIPIYHRDVKSSNILLDEKFKAKVSDFGTSRLISIEQTHLTTHVQGTFGYLDPEYFQSSQFTEKSDVYSFGVVLVELLTSEKAVLSLERAEGRSLATHFIDSMEENRVMGIVDARIVKQAKPEEVMMVAKLAYRCLSLSGKKRPTMKEVAMQLENIIMPLLPKDSNVEHHHNQEEMDYLKLDLPFPWDSISSSTDSNSSFSSRNTRSIEMKPLV